MTATLVRKELREHGWVLGAVLLLDALSLYGYMIQADRAGGRLLGLVSFTRAMVPVTALVLANRLVVREFTGRTQLFLETLPVGRWRVFSTKWLLGASVLVGLVTGAWWFVLEGRRAHEVIDTGEAAYALVASLLLALAVWSIAFLMGLLGRYRYVAWIALAVLAWLLVEKAGFAAGELPLARLVSDVVAMSRRAPPWVAVWEALALILLGLAGAAFLVLPGAESLATTLSGRMSPRERTVLVGLGVAGLMAVGALAKEHDKPPFELQSAEAVGEGAGRVGVLLAAGVDPERAESLAKAVSSDLAEAARAFGFERKLPVFLLPQAGLDPESMPRAVIPKAEGIVLRVSPDAEPALVRTHVLHDVLAESGRDDLVEDGPHVLLDGMAASFALRNDETARDLWWLRAAALPEPVTAGALQDWARTFETLGTCQSLALAFAVAETANGLLGVDRSRALAAELFRSVPDDVRGWWPPRLESLLEEAGTNLETLAAATEAARRDRATREHVRLSKRPQVTSAIRYEVSDHDRVLTAWLDGARRWRALYTQLGPWSAGLPELPRIDTSLRTVRLPLPVSSGDRVFVALEYDDPLLRCAVRRDAGRWVIP